MSTPPVAPSDGEALPPPGEPGPDDRTIDDVSTVRPPAPTPAPAPTDMFSAPPAAGGGEEWLTTYADAITLLMAFFVMMFSVSKVDLSKFEAVKEALHAEFGAAEDPTAPAPKKPAPAPEADAPAKPTAEPPRSTGSLLELAQSDARLAGLLSDVQLTERGVVLRFGSSAFFAPGSATLLAPARQALLTLSFELDPLMLTGHRLAIEGHTDPSPPGKSGRFKTNWTLSASRAAAVAGFLVDQGLPPAQVEATGFAATRPLGKGAAADRRVVLRVEQRPSP